DLLKTLQAAVSGNLETAVVGLLKPAAQYDAHEIKLAMKSYSVACPSSPQVPDGATLAEILCTRTTQQLREILDFYKHATAAPSQAAPSRKLIPHLPRRSKCNPFLVIWICSPLTPQPTPRLDFKSDLEADIASGPSGSFKDLLLALIKTSREKYSGVIDYVLIEQDAKALVNAGSGYVDGTDEKKWTGILTQRSPEHLNRGKTVTRL
ncbi:UNVERIFIED_CONTAM: hypothetical protein K2H54_028435, partial [Gekko kuhli]